MRTATTNFNWCKNDEGYQNAKMPFFLSYYVSNEQYLGILEGFHCLLQQLLLHPWYMYFKIEFLSVYNLVKAFLYAKTTFNFGIYESQANIYNVLLNKLSCRDYLPYAVSNDIDKNPQILFALKRCRSFIDILDANKIFSTVALRYLYFDKYIRLNRSYTMQDCSCILYTRGRHI